MDKRDLPVIVIVIGGNNTKLQTVPLSHKSLSQDCNYDNDILNPYAPRVAKRVSKRLRYGIICCTW